ncbi:MAG: hypothetical protein V4494_00445 [Chlamydiota bacterium]
MMLSFAQKEGANIATNKKTRRRESMLKAKSTATLLQISIVFGLLSLCVIGFFLLSKGKKIDGISDIRNKLNQIPLEDKIEIENLFRTLVFEDSFSFTLFGDKPISWESRYHFNSQKSKKPRTLFRALHRSNLKVRRGWAVWQKYSSLFPSSLYVFKGFEEDDSFAIVLINKAAFLNTVAQYQEDFKRVLGGNISPLGLLDQCENQEFSTAIHQHEALIGILLGFGRNNSFRFERLTQISEFGQDHQLHLIEPPPAPRQGFISIEEEFLDLKKRHQSLISDADVAIYALCLPAFASDPDDRETEYLKNNYSRQRKEILKRFAKGDFLEVTLEQLTHR